MEISDDFHESWTPLLQQLHDVAQIGHDLKRVSVRLVAAFIGVSAIAAPWVEIWLHYR